MGLNDAVAQVNDWIKNIDSAQPEDHDHHSSCPARVHVVTEAAR